MEKKEKEVQIKEEKKEREKKKPEKKKEAKLREGFHRKKIKKWIIPHLGGEGVRENVAIPHFFFLFFGQKGGDFFSSFKKGKSMYLLPFNNLLSKMVWNRAKCPFLYFISLWKPSPIAREL